jgi:methylase of polypeptide subunit release factors
MADIWRRLEHRRIKPLLRRIRPWRPTTLAGIRVHYKMHLDGGGSAFGQDYIPLLRAWGVPRQTRAFEWCAGPGFIGFSLLGHGLCETLCLADINREAVAACRRTIRDNALTGRATIYHSDNLKNVPPGERFDFVVGNPPHFADASPGQLRYHDKDWNTHRAFFGTIGQFLAPAGVIVLQENNHGSVAEMFRSMIEAAGLAIVFVHGDEPKRTPVSQMYYIGIMRRGDTAPGWVLHAAH